MATLKVGADGKAPANAKVGDTIVTAGGNYKITGGTSGNWTSEKVSGSGSNSTQKPGVVPGKTGGSNNSSSGQNSGGYNGTGFSGSTSGIQGYNDAQREILNKMNQNSIAWWDADSATRQTLASQNEEYARQLGAVGLPVYKDESGHWYATSQQEIQNPHMNAYLGYDTMQQDNKALAEQYYKQYVQQGTARLNAQRGGINSSYDDAARQAYISYQQQQKALPQQMAAIGMTGGATESSMVQQQAAYQGNLSGLESARNKALNDISSAITDLQNSGDLQTAQYILNNADKISEAYLSALNADISRKDSLSQQAQQNAYNAALLTGIYNGNPTLDAQQAAFSKAQQLLSMGFSSAEIAKLLGITEQQAQQYASMVNQGMQLDLASAQATLNKKLSSGSSGGSSPASPVNYGDHEPEGTNPAPALQSVYNKVRDTALALFSAGTPSAQVAAYLDSFEGQLSDDEKWQIMQQLNLYGARGG